MYGIVYKFQNVVNNKIYIGKTIKDFYIRYKQHIDNSVKGNSYFNNAMKKWGISNFSWDVIDIGSNKDDLNDKERYWIMYYNSNNSVYGYNLTSGGDGGKQNEEVIEKIRVKLIGRKRGPVSLEVLKKMSECRMGHPVSEETKKKIGVANTGRKPSKESERKRLESRKWYRHSEETIIKIKEGNIGKKRIKEQKETMSIAQRNKFISEESKKRMKYWEGKECPIERKIKTSESMKRYWENKKNNEVVDVEQVSKDKNHYQLKKKGE